MSTFLKWAESQLEKFDNYSNQVEPTNSNQEELKAYIEKLKNDIKTLRNMFHTQIQELQDRYHVQLNNMQQTNSTLQISMKQLQQESFIVKEKLSTSQEQLASIEQVNQQLLETLQKPRQLDESKPEQQLTYQNSIYQQQLANYKQLLASQKMKAADALSQIKQLEELLENSKETFSKSQNQLTEKISRQIQKEKKLEQMLQETKKAGKSSDDQNMMALSEHLQNKQRIIQSLISEKATTLYQLEMEKKEKIRLMEGHNVGSVKMVPLSSFKTFKGRKMKTVGNWCDQIYTEASHTLHEVPMARIAFFTYFFVIHILLFAWLFTPSQQTFLGE